MAEYDLSSGGEEDEELKITQLSDSLASTFIDCDQGDDFCDDHWSSHWMPTPIRGHVDINVDEDDGWISDPEQCVPVQLPPPQETQPLPDNYKPYMSYDDDAWVDEAKGTFNTYKTSDPTKVTELLREMFDAHKDVYSLLLAFLNRTGRVRMQKKSLPRVVLTEFQAWLGEFHEKPKSAVLTAGHRKEALQILTKCHAVLMDDMMAIFDLQAADKTAQLDLIDHLLVEGRLKEAVTYTWKFGLQEHFEMSSMLLPLVALDKINLIENYVEGSRKLQEEFVSLLNDLCEPGTTKTKIDMFLSQSTTLVATGAMDELLSKSNCKLNFKQLYRLAHRMVTKYSLDLSKFSHIHSRWSSGSLHHLLHMRYVEGSITATNINDLLESIIEDNVTLQLQLVKELVHFNDIPAAVHWARTCRLPQEELPFAVQVQLEKTQSWLKKNMGKTATPKKKSGTNFYQLSLPLSSVVFVDTLAGLEHCWEAIKQPNTIVGMDAEWKLPYCNKGIERLAVLQLAVEKRVYLLDMVRLPRVVREEPLTEFMTSLLHSPHILKLGYDIQSDLHMLSKSWPFVRAIASSPVMVLDLVLLNKMVKDLRNSHKVTTLPAHPLLKTTPTIPREPTQTSLAISGGWAQDESSGKTGGLAVLVEKCFGKPLDKSQQLSDWEKRPLTSEQITYAALDAHCLLGVYKYLMAEAMNHDFSFNIQPALIS